MPSYSRKVDLPGKSAQEIYDKVAGDIDRFLGKGSLPVQVDIERDPAKREVHAKSSMFSATLVCKEGLIQLDAKLSLLATPFKGKLDEGITKWISKNFGTQSA